MQLRAKLRQTLCAFTLTACVVFDHGAARAAEQPSVNVQANGPGWITITYSHSGTGGVSWYKIERQGGGSTTLHSPNGQWTDNNLQPDTEYAYTVCAVYEDGDEACVGPIAARTLPAAGKPANFDPPIITGVQVNESSITVSWGQTGDYSKILARIDQSQVDLKNIPNASYTFGGLKPDTRYRIVLKGCSKTLLGSSCGPWSPEQFIATAALASDPPPPSKPTLKVSSPSEGAVLLEFSVKVANSNAADQFAVYRGNSKIASVSPKGAGNGWTGSFTDTVQYFEQFHYRVCFEGQSPRATVCSSMVAGPKPGVDIQTKVPPSGDMTKPFDPGIEIQVSPGAGNLDMMKK